MTGCISTLVYRVYMYINCFDKICFLIYVAFIEYYLFHIFRTGSVCSHMAALLFALQDYIAEGLLKTPSDLACTDKLKTWNVPARRTVEHTTISNVKIYRYGNIPDTINRNSNTLPKCPLFYLIFHFNTLPL